MDWVLEPEGALETFDVVESGVAVEGIICWTFSCSVILSGCEVDVSLITEEMFDTSTQD